MLTEKARGQRRVSRTAIGAVLAIAVLQLAPGGMQTAEAQALCHGFVVTIDIGAGDSPTPGNDVILGTSAADIINAGAGHDVVCGGGGNDRIRGQAGSDQLFGDDGNDRLDGGGGSDILSGGPGGDRLFGKSGSDLLLGGPGVDRMWGGVGDDEIHGNGGPDEAYGESGDDTIYGGNAGDELDGGDGVDTIEAGAGDDILEGGAGSDVLRGGVGDDLIAGGDGHDLLIGGVGNDEIHGHAGLDIGTGGPDDDELFGGPDNDDLAGGSGIDFADGAEGDDTCAAETVQSCNEPPNQCVTVTEGRFFLDLPNFPDIDDEPSFIVIGDFEIDATQPDPSSMLISWPRCDSDSTDVRLSYKQPRTFEIELELPAPVAVGSAAPSDHYNAWAFTDADSHPIATILPIQTSRLIDLDTLDFSGDLPRLGYGGHVCFMLEAAADGEWFPVANVTPVCRTIDRASTTPQTIVSIGDSYTAGPTENPDDYVWGEDTRELSDPMMKCFRSVNSWAFLVGAHFKGFYDARHTACTSAVASDMDASLDVEPYPNGDNYIDGLPAAQEVTSDFPDDYVCCGPVNSPEYQIPDALDSNVAYVMMSIGGNDLGFGDIVTSCYVAAKASPLDGIAQALLADHIAAAAPCPTEQEMIDRGDEFLFGPNDGLVNGRLPTLYRLIKQQAPNADIVIAGYPFLVDDVPDEDCTWNNPQALRNAQADFDDKLLEVIDALNAEGGPRIHFVRFSDIYEGHGVCTTGGEQWIYDLDFDLFGGGPGDIVAIRTFHPTPDGHAAGALEVIDCINKTKFDSSPVNVCDTAPPEGPTGVDTLGDTVVLTEQVQATGNVYVVTTSPTRLEQIAPDGTVIWSKQLASSFDPRAMEVGPNGDVWVAGHNTVGNWQAAVYRYDPLGVLVFQRHFGGSRLENCESVTVDASSNAYCGGRTMSDDWVSPAVIPGDGNRDTDAFVTKLSPTGTILWSTAMTGAVSGKYESPIEIRNLAVTPTGNVFAFGFTGDRNNDGVEVIGALALVILDADDGSEISSQQLEIGTYEAAGSIYGQYTQVHDVIVSADGTKVWAVGALHFRDPNASGGGYQPKQGIIWTFDLDGTMIGAPVTIPDRNVGGWDQAFKIEEDSAGDIFIHISFLGVPGGGNGSEILKTTSAFASFDLVYGVYEDQNRFRRVAVTDDAFWIGNTRPAAGSPALLRVPRDGIN